MNPAEYDLVKECDASLGSFCTITLVRRKEDNKELIIKKQKIDEWNYAINEAAIINKLSHSNIITFYKSWKNEDDIYFLMEYASGGTLYELMENVDQPMEEEAALDFFSQLVLGLDHLHSRSIMHRDIKPENIMFAGPLKKIKIIDFGLSRDTSAQLLVPMMNPNQYTAPENWDEDVPHTFKTDIWSIGALLYEVSTTVDPKHIDKNLEDLDKLPLSVSTICKILLKLSPDERPETREVIRYTELRPSMLKYHQSLGLPENKIVEKQLKDILSR